VACLECSVGFYPFENKCLRCSAEDKFGENCLDCTSGGCTKCKKEYFVSYGECIDCKFMDGCEDGECTSTGCKKCRKGYYLDEGNCKACSTAISGCIDCRSADLCITCASNFLTIDEGICKCRQGTKNQVTDELTGACKCIDGYYMTNKGCQTCGYLIPGCEQCSVVSQITGIPIYSEAQFAVSQQYLDCERCAYSRYVKPASIRSDADTIVGDIRQ